MSHTKGPWRVIRRPAASDNSRGFDIVGPAGPIAHVFPVDPGGVEGRANADLMAAAPLMLEALEMIANGAPDEQPELYEGDNYDGAARNAAAREHWRLARLARAAVAKARGGS